jgi:hypothetical protein
MGHCEMLLAVAGLDSNQITNRTRILASADWSGLPPSDRAAFGFARKLSQTPWKAEAADFQTLEKHFGRHRAVDVAWWTARCQYMTRVADAFQLPLERDNVFQRPASKGDGSKSEGTKKGRPKTGESKAQESKKGAMKTAAVDVKPKSN